MLTVNIFRSHPVLERGLQQLLLNPPVVVYQLNLQFHPVANGDCNNQDNEFRTR